ncbi:UPF0481 protein [Trifolium repens]|nr:UPF0481 protein [Trifolium repens]
MEDEDIRYMRWKQTTKALLGAVRKETYQPYSIPAVPDDLRKSNESAYMPKLVSIGPRYKGKKELLPMEEIKWCCVTSLISRTFGQDTIETCLETVIKLDAAVRASYVDVITLDRYDLATNMVFDGCFLLELIICESTLDTEIPIPFNGKSPGIEVKKMEYVISDLMLVDNQIPLFILKTLFEKLIGSSNQMHEFIQNLALPLFGLSGKLMVKSTSHFLDVIYSYLEMGWVDKKIENDYSYLEMGWVDKKIDNEVRIYLGNVRHLFQEQRLHRCATRLKAAGITIQSLENDDDINFKLTTHFYERKGRLEIPRLIITQTTEVKWRSFIAWEHHKKKLSTRSSSAADWRSSICTSTALLFRDLICCPSDVQLLKDRRVIVDQSNKSNRDLVAFFHSIASGIDSGIIDRKHTTMFLALNIFRTKRNYLTKIFILLRHYFSRSAWWEYMVFASVVTFLTFVQTCYAIIAYHFPK